jgi:ribosomal protein L37AE/L43A
MSERAAPYYCPYCAEEDLEPYGDEHGVWRCRACLRVWRLSYVGSTPPPQQPARGASADPLP